MRSGWLFRAALHLTSPDWRATLRSDLEEEATAEQRGSFWCAWQALRVGISFRWSLGGEALMSDLRYAIRSLLSARWFTAGAILTFALGIGVNIAVFSAVDRLLFRPLPYADVKSLVLLRSCNRTTGECTTGSFPSAVEYQLQQQSTTLQDLAIAGFPQALAPTRDAGAESTFSMLEVSPRILRALGVAPAMGRDITNEEIASRTLTAWVSYEAWQARLATDPTVVGRTFWQGAKPVTVIGILPRGFIPPAWSGSYPQWAGLVATYEGWSSIGPSGRTLAPFARLKPGATVAAAQAEVAAVQDALAKETTKPGQSPEYLRVDSIQSSLFSQVRRYLWLVSAAAALVLLMACANLASLLVARGRSREHLAAINTALGASRARLLRTMLIESAIVCLAGAVIGVAAVAATSKGLLTVLPPLFSRYAAGVADPRVAFFAIGAALVSALVAGLIPAWRATRVDVLAILQKGTRSGRRTRVRGGRGLIAAEAALGALLVLGSVVAVRSFIVLAIDPLGFQPRDLYVVSVGVTGRPTMEEQRTRIEQALEVVRLVPGVAAAAASDNVPASGEGPVRGFARDQKSGARVQVSANYFETLGATLLTGRAFTPEDVASRANVAMLSRLGVELVWPGMTPHQVLGRLWEPAGETPREIVGVVDEMKNSYGVDRGRPTAYVPLGAEPTPWRSIVVRAQPGATLQIEAIRARAQERLGREVRVSMSSVGDSMDRDLQHPRFLAILFTTLALTGLCLAVIGLYAVTSYDVSLRRYEMGVRVVMGATAADLKRLVRREALVPVLIGAASGLVAAYWLAQFAQGFLYRTDGREPWLYLIVAGVLVATTLVASWWPARRVAATDPATVLRAQ